MESNNKQIHDLLEEIFYLWSDITTDENGDELRMPASNEEAKKSREILDKIVQMDFSDKELIQRYGQLNGIIKEYEEKFLFLESPNGQADKLLDDMFNLWSTVSEEDGTEYHSPANDEEISRSWELIDKIGDLRFDDKEVAERLETYKNVLKTFEADEDKDNSVEEESDATKDDIKALKILDKIYDLWTNVTTEDDNEYRSPKNKREISRSRIQMRKIKVKKISNQYVLDRKEELEGVLDSIENSIPNYNKRIIFSLLFSLVFIIGFFFIPLSKQFNIPDYDYNKEWFTTVADGHIYRKGNVSRDEDVASTRQAFIQLGTALKPTGRFARYDLQVETPDGQRGFVDYTILKGAEFVKAKKNIVVFDSIEGIPSDSVKSGTKGQIIERQERKGHSVMLRYIKLKLEDGRVKWGNDYDFVNIILENIPNINQTYRYRTTPDAIRQNMIGKSLSNIEKHYGKASSHINVDGLNEAYFRHLIVVDGRYHHTGVLVTLTSDNRADDIKYFGKGKKKFYDRFPIVAKMWKYEPNALYNASFYLGNEKSFEIKWWKSFRNINWITKIFGWIISVIFFLLATFIFLSIPRFVISPVLQFFMFTKFLGNGMVTLINIILYFSVTYFYFVYMILVMDQWFLPLIASIIIFVIWANLLMSDISYNRCPSCHTMYSALDEGSSYTGRSTNTTWGTYDVDKGTTSTSTKITHHYERRDKKTTEHVDSYLDHRMCALCSYEWDVDRDETEEKTEYL